MSKLVERKWRIAGGVGFALLLTLDLIGKHIASERMMDVAKRTAGLPLEPRGWLATQFPFDVILSLELFVALPAAVCWGVSAYRNEPGSSFPLVVLAVLCLGSFFIIV